MPWKECHVMDERPRFVGRLLDRERMTTLCEEFGYPRGRTTNSTTAIKPSARRAEPTRAGGRSGTRIEYRRSSNARSCH